LNELQWLRGIIFQRIGQKRGCRQSGWGRLRDKRFELRPTFGFIRGLVHNIAGYVGTSTDGKHAEQLDGTDANPCRHCDTPLQFKPFGFSLDCRRAEATRLPSTLQGSVQPAVNGSFVAANFRC